MIQAGNELSSHASSISTNHSSPKHRWARSNARTAVRLSTARFRLIFSLTPIILILAAGLGCSSEKPAEPTVSVQVVPVNKTTIEQTVTSEAVLYRLAQSAIVPRISAPIKAFYVNRGSKVRAGQLLGTLENRDLAAAAQDNQGSYDQAQAAYTIATASTLPEEIQKAQGDTQAAKVALEAEQKLYDNRQDLYKQGTLPRKDLDQAAVALTQAKNQYELAQRHLDALMAVSKQQELKSAAGQPQSAKGKYLGAQAQLSYSEIGTPINGVVTDRSLYPGEMAAAGTPLLTVMDLPQMVARAHLPQQSALQLKIGDKSTVTVPGLDAGFPAKVSLVSPALDSGSTTVEIWFSLKNPGERLKAGTSVQISAVARSVADALAVPVAALLTASDGTTSVMVAASDGRAHQKNVKTGIRTDALVQITEGVQAGEPRVEP